MAGRDYDKWKNVFGWQFQEFLFKINYQRITDKEKQQAQRK